MTDEIEKQDKYKIDYKHNWKEYLSFLGKYKIIIVATLFVVLLHEAKQVMDKYLFKIMIDKGTDYASQIITLDKFTQIAIIVGIIFIGGTLLSVLCNWLKLHWLNKFESGIMLDLKQKYFSHILHLDQGFHATHKTGSLISKLSRSGSATERLTDTLFFDFAPLVFQTIIAVIAMIYLDKIQALIIGIIMILFISFSYLMQRISEESNIAANKAEDIEKGNMADFFTNLDSIRFFGKEALIKERYNSLSDTTRKLFMKNWNYYRYTSAGQSLILGAGTFFLIFFSIKAFLQGSITLGTLGFIYTAYYSLIGPLFGFVHGIRNISRSMADYQELFEYGKISSKIKDKVNAKNLKIEKANIEFKNISFSYNEKRKIFENFSLKIPRNKKIALVGHSGCGKTTLVKLLYRLYDADSGEILVDDHNISDITQDSLRNEMSIVPQECILFDDTLYNNILFSKPNATRKEVIEAIKFSQLDKFIETLPNKENTIVGERGVKLSGGERQRVSIARAILADKKILVLDEATSSLDSETEFEIQKALKKLMEGRTSIIIAHRLSTIMNSDIIVVMKEGKIMQMGSHRDLITEGGEYQRLWDFQKGGYVTESFEHEAKDDGREYE
jgi:ATP-binding cassette subfamily B protein